MSEPTGAQRVLARLRAELGYTESPPGSNCTKYGRKYGLDGQPWCSIFVWWGYDQEQVDLRQEVASGYAYTPAAVAGFKARGWWHERSPRPGDVVFYDFPGGKARTEHTGVVDEVTAAGVYAIEGNTGAGDDTNGGAVQRRFRPWGHIVGFGRVPDSVFPAKPAQRPASPAPDPSEEDDDMRKRYLVTHPVTTKQYLVDDELKSKAPLGEMPDVNALAADGAVRFKLSEKTLDAIPLTSAIGR